MVGVEKSKAVVESVAKILNGVSGFVHKQGLLSLIPVVMEAQKLISVDWKGVLEEVKDTSTPEGAELEKALMDNLNLVNKAVQLKIGEAIDCVQEGVELGVKVASDVQEYIVKGKAYYKKVKSLVSVPKTQLP